MTPEEYLDFIHGERVGMAPIALRGPSGAITNYQFFSWPDQKADMLEYIDRHKDQDVYATVALFSGMRPIKAGVRSLAVVESDADTFDVSMARLEPSLIVTTSEGHTHLYWAITDCEDPDVIESLARGVSVAHPKGETGLDTGWQRNKVLRVPGTTNTKYDEPFIVTAEATGVVYTRAEFEAAYEPVEGDSVTIEKKKRGEIPSRAEAIASLTPSALLLELIDLSNSARVLQKSTSPSEPRFLLINELIRCGATDEAAFAVLSGHPFCSTKTESDIWGDVLRARAKAEFPPEEIEHEDDHIQVTVAARKVAKEVDFLYRNEKDQLRPDFISRYLAWAQTKTDANPEFHIAMAFTLLSVVFSDHGHALPKFGALPLNMWFMVLGETTRSRKSTAKNLMLSVLKRLSDDEMYKYDLGSDFTAEALDNELLDRPHRSALAYVDEFQGLLDSMEKKAYLSGMKGKLTELFDGFATGKLRATADKKRQGRVPIAFTFLAMGIRDKAAALMSEEDFQSGFLARFCYVQANAPKRSKESDYLEQADPETISMGDRVLDDLADEIRQARDHWAAFRDIDHETLTFGPTMPVPCEADAWERLNNFISDVLDAAEGHERGPILEAAAQRLSLAILKAATLLAMSECADKVQMPHMLSAINYGAQWFHHLTVMAEKISASGFRKRQNEVADYLFEMAGRASWTKARRKFRDWQNREFAEVVDALVGAGYVELSDKKELILTDVGIQEIAA